MSRCLRYYCQSNLGGFVLVSSCLGRRCSLVDLLLRLRVGCSVGHRLGLRLGWLSRWLLAQRLRRLWPRLRQLAGPHWRRFERLERRLQERLLQRSRQSGLRQQVRLGRHWQQWLLLRRVRRLQPQLPHSLQPRAGRQRQLRRFPLLLGDRILRVVQLRPPKPRCLVPKRLPKSAAGRQ